MWTDRKVLVTGANGFIGSHLVERLVEEGADVVAFVRSTAGHRVYNIRSVADSVDVFAGDLQDQHSVRRAVRELEDCSESIIFHLGAQTHVGESWERPYETFRTNALGTMNLLQAVVDLDIDLQTFETAGTSEQYGNRDEARLEHYDGEEGEVVLDEKAPVNPTSIYATSKVAADFLTRNYHDAYGLPAVTTRMFNNYGPRQSTRCITGTIITQALTSDTVRLGNLGTKRDMCFVSDGVRGHMDVAMHGEPGEVYTFGYGESISMRDWAEMILDIGSEEGFWEDTMQIVQDEERFRPGDSDVEELRAGFDKLHELTGWKPQVSWREGIQRTIRWYDTYRDWWG